MVWFEEEDGTNWLFRRLGDPYDDPWFPSHDTRIEYAELVSGWCSKPPEEALEVEGEEDDVWIEHVNCQQFPDLSTCANTSEVDVHYSVLCSGFKDVDALSQAWEDLLVSALRAPNGEAVIAQLTALA